ncbi:hypothetical protein V3G39_16765 [Dermatophilaceae bacterium Sec6.4]|nr:hypothetical protein [Actinomycetota bacterium]
MTRPGTATIGQGAPDLSAQVQGVEAGYQADTHRSPVGGNPTAGDSADREEQWWREQRPPHWE